jgi:hypothetical protein
MNDIIDILKTLEGMAGPVLWVGMDTIALVFLYKTLVIGSIYGLVKFISGQVHDVVLTKKTEVPIKTKVEIEGQINGITITTDGTLDALISQIRRLRGIRTDSTYIRDRDVEWLTETIDEKMQRPEETQ